MTGLPRNVALALTLTLLAGCGGRQVVETTTVTPSQRPDQTPFIPPQFDTAATRNCLTLGGTLTITTGTGPDRALCALPGGATVGVEQLLRETRA